MNICWQANQRRQLEIYGQHASAIKAEREAREKAEDLMVAEVAQKQCEESEKQRILLARKSKALLKVFKLLPHGRMHVKNVW